MIVMTAYILFGKFVSGLSFFTDNDVRILIILFTGWGLCQISSAFLLSVFLNDAQTATMTGYCFSIIFTVVSSTIMVSGSGCGAHGDHVMLDRFLVNPTFSYAHVIFYLCDECTWDACIGDITTLEWKIWRSLLALYVHAFIYLVLAVYL